MPLQGLLVYRTQAQIVDNVLAAIAARIPDATLTPDTIFAIWAAVFANSAEGLYLANQILHDDLFIQTASALALQRYGEMYGRPQLGGTVASGNVLVSGVAGTFIPAGSQFGSPRAALDDELLFDTSDDASIPDPGTPTAPTTTQGSATGLTGTYEYAVTFTTAEGETTLGVSSTPLIVAAHKIDVSAIPLGGPGTTGRKLYRRKDGGAWGLIHTFGDNTTTVLASDNTADGVVVPPDTSTAERVTIPVVADEAGLDYNVTANTITDLLDVPVGVTSVTNVSAVSGGDDGEDIETFRSNLLQFVRAPQSGSGDDLVTWAKSIQGVESATTFPNKDLSNVDAPGTVSVRISGPDGTIPDSDVIDAVQAYLDSKDLANITILVGTFAAHTIAVTVDITLDGTYTLLEVTPSVEAAITAYVNAVDVGGTVYLAGIASAVFGLAGVATVEVTTPAIDTTSTATQKPVAGTITVNEA